MVTLTGLGLKFSSIVIDYAGGSLLLTAIYTALIVWIVGLAVPVTASYIICAVIAAPAMIKLGVPDYAAQVRQTPVARLRVGVPRVHFYDHLEAEVRAVTLAALAKRSLPVRLRDGIAWLFTPYL